MRTVKRNDRDAGCALNGAQRSRLGRQRRGMPSGTGGPQPCSVVCSSWNLIGQSAPEVGRVRLSDVSGGDQFFPCERGGVKEGLHRRFSGAPAALMRPVPL